MYKNIHCIVAFLVLLIAVLACALPPVGTAPANLETVVASTLSALTAPVIPAETLPAPSSVPALLPASMYFINNDSSNLKQLYRLDVDGETVTQVTFEPANVDEYDVSQVDGRIAYTSNNQLFLIERDGSGRSMIVDGGLLDMNDPATTIVTNPIWSPDARTIAYGKKGINFYSFTTGQSTLALASPIDSTGFGKMYWPESYSPDGTKLIITVAPIASDGASNAIYHPDTNVMMDITYPSTGGGYLCCSYDWTEDGRSIYTGVSFVSPFLTAGLWRLDTTTGVVEVLLTSDEFAESFDLANAPMLAPDGQLYFLYAHQTGLNDYTTIVDLQLVRSAPDGVSGRTVLRPESFTSANGFLWAPDASFLIATTPPGPDVYEGGAAHLYYTDGRPAIFLLPFASNMKWGP